MPTDIVEQLETQVVAMQFSLCSKQKQMQDYFKSSPRAPTPSKEQRAPTPTKDVSFKTVADATKDVSLVDLLDMDDIELESIDTTIASVAASALMKETPTRFSTPKSSATLPPHAPEWVWTPISVLSTQRRPKCAPSVHSAHIIWILYNDTKRSTSRTSFGVDWGNVTGYCEL